MALKDLFKKYGLNDYINLKFNAVTQQYEFYYYGNPVPYKKLDSEAKRYLDSNNKALIDSPYLINKELAQIEHDKKVVERSNKLSKMGYGCSSTMFISDIKISPISEDFSNKLDKMLSEENVLYGIHRIGYTSSEEITDILENGLIMTGHGVYVSQDSLELYQNVGYYADNMQIKDELLNAHGYHSSQGSLLIRIPDEDLEKRNIFIEKENDFKRLNPKYIIGYVPFIKLSDGSVTIDRIITLNDLKKSYSQDIEKQEQPIIVNDDINTSYDYQQEETTTKLK